MPTFELSYGGVPLCIDQDTRSVVHDWLDRSIPLDDLREIVPERPWPGAGLLGATRPYRYPDRPKLRLGQYFYPVGASRWSEGNFLITQKEYDLIIPLAYTSGGPQPLTFLMQGATDTVSTPLYLLPPRPLARFGGNPGLYLITLVDERYFWQNQSAPLQLAITTWDDLISQIASSLGIGVSTAADAVYGKPHPFSDFETQYENAALLLDAALRNIGLTFVRTLGGGYMAMTAVDSSIQAQAARGLVLAGGDSTDDDLTSAAPGLVQNAMMPKKVTVTYQLKNGDGGDWVNAQDKHIPYSRNLGDRRNIDVLITDAGYGAYAGYPYSVTLHTTAEGYSCDNGSTINNMDDLNALALQLATDYYDAQADGLDEVYPGVVNWPVEGLHDVTWVWMSDKCHTRVQVMPLNYWADTEFMHHFDDISCSTSSVSPSGADVDVVTDVTCDHTGGLVVVHKTLSGYVQIGGTQYPLTLETS